MKDFTFEQQSGNGWVFAKNSRSDVFLFGPTLADVVAQAAQAEEFLAGARRDDTDTRIEMPDTSGLEWRHLELA